MEFRNSAGIGSLLSYFVSVAKDVIGAKSRSVWLPSPGLADPAL